MLKTPKPPEQLAAIETLQAHVEQQFESLRETYPFPYGYVLLERGLDERVLRMATAQLKDYPHEVLYEGTPEEHLAEECSPWLVQLPVLPDETLLRQLCIASQRFAAIAWIWSPLELEDLADHLRHFMGATLWNDQNGEEEGEIAVRCTDPRVFPAFMQALLPEQKEELLRPLTAWALWDRHLQWRMWEGPADLEPFTPAPLRISITQLGAMNHHTQPDKILSLLEDEYGEGVEEDNDVRQQLLQLPQDERYRNLFAVIETARKMGFDNDADLMLFSAMIYSVHPWFYELPLFRAEIEKGRRAGKPLEHIVVRMPDSVWEEVKKAYAATENAAAPLISTLCSS